MATFELENQNLDSDYESDSDYSKCSINLELDDYEYHGEEEIDYNSMDKYYPMHQLNNIFEQLRIDGYRYYGYYEDKSWYNHRNIIFERTIAYSDKSGNWIDDNHLKITLQYNNSWNIAKDKHFIHNLYKYGEKYIEHLKKMIYNSK